jgi:hypothetical protein
MAGRSRQMRFVEEAIARKREEIKKLQIELAALEDVLKRASPDALPQRKRAPRSNVKNLVLELLEEVGRTGLNAASAVERAERRGERLERGTVSSLLSRLKHDRVVKYDGTVYRLGKYGSDEGASDAEERQEAIVHPFPASKSAS